MQVLGHSKTMLVLLGGWAFLGDQINLKQLAGMALAVVGMVAYGVASNQYATLRHMLVPLNLPDCANSPLMLIPWQLPDCLKTSPLEQILTNA